MASATFGRKGLSADVVGQPARRRPQFGQAAAAPATVASADAAPADPLADRRAAFLAAERARAADLGDVGRPDSDDPATPATARPTLFVREKSLGTAFVLWFFLGGFSAHRFYLGSPLSAIAQVALWYVSLMFFMAGNAGAFYPLAVGWLWILGDAFLIPQLRLRANERARERAALLAEPVSS